MISSRDGMGKLGVVRDVSTRWRQRAASPRNDQMTATHLSCLRTCPAALACERTSFRNELTSSTINFFMPSIESSSSNEKSNFCVTLDPWEKKGGKRVGRSDARADNDGKKKVPLHKEVRRPDRAIPSGRDGSMLARSRSAWQGQSTASGRAGR